MKNLNLLIPYYASMTSVLKIFILYILSKWYGISFAYPFIFLFFKAYQIIIHKRYKIFPLTTIDYIHILKSIYQKSYIKEIKIKANKEKDEIIKLMKQFIALNNNLKKILVYNFCNYYWKILTVDEIINKVIIDKEINDLEKKLDKKFELLKEPSYKIYFLDNKQKLVIKYNSINYEDVNLLAKYIEYNNEKKNINNKKLNKFVKLMIEFITFPLYLSLEIVIIFLLSISYL